MRVVYLSPVGTVGGAERVLLSVMAAVRRAEPGWPLRLIALDSGPLLEAAAELGAEVEVCPLPERLARAGDSRLRQSSRVRGACRGLFQAVAAVPAAWHHVRQFGRRLSAARPDLIHSNGIKTHLLARLARPPQYAVVWHIHDFYSLRPLAARLLRRARGGVRAAIAVSEAVAADARAELPGVRVEVVRNTVDLGRFTPGRGAGEALDLLAGLPVAPPGTVRVGMVATYARWKGQDVFLRAAARATEAVGGPPLRFYVVGGPIYRTAAQFTSEELRAIAGSLGLGSAIGFVPFRPDPAEVYRSLDIVVHASTLPEPFGLTIAEAMACGRPVIVSRAGGAAELFQDGHDGLGVPPGDVDALAAAIRALAVDASLRGRLGAAARGTAEHAFDPGRLCDRFPAVYRRAVTAGGFPAIAPLG